MHETALRYDTLLIDLGLPDIPGDRGAAEMRKEDPAIATILITGWELEKDDPRLSAFDFYVQKPLRLGELLESITQSVELRDSRSGA